MTENKYSDKTEDRDTDRAGNEIIVVAGVTIERESAVVARHVPFNQLPSEVWYQARDMLQHLIDQIDDHLEAEAEEIASELAEE